MPRWVQQNDLWQLWPDGAPRGLIEFIGGSYLAASPQLSYRRLLEALAERGWIIHAWSYVPGFDHQIQANQAWGAFRRQRLLLEKDDGAAVAEASEAMDQTAQPASSVIGGRLQVLRLGHSLGCKLHLLAPDAGRHGDGLVALAFNNFSAERSVPLLAEMGQQFGFRSEFSPSPAETLRLVARHYQQPRNLLVRFNRDSLDQSNRLLAALLQRPDDASRLMELAGDHLSVASAGLRRQLLGDWADDPARQRQIEALASRIESWWLDG